MATVAQIPFTAFSCSSRKAEHVQDRLDVRRLPDLNPNESEGVPTPLDNHRFNTCFPASGLDTVSADKNHRAHAIVEQIDTD